jgi:hypothetical protein
MVLSTGTDSSAIIDFFSIEKIPTVKKSNPAAEPHGSQQGCTIRPRKGAGQSSMGLGFRVFSVSHATLGFLHPLPQS